MCYAAETVILSGGEVVSPFSIESSILGEIPFLRRVMVVGDKRPHLICLMTLKVGDLFGSSNQIYWHKYIDTCIYIQTIYIYICMYIAL